jgi:hypothetical protein
MIIAATSALMASNIHQLKLAILLFTATGITLSIIQLLISYRHFLTQKKIKMELGKYEPKWACIYNHRDNSPNSATLIGTAVPIVILVCWICLLFLIIFKFDC